MRRLLSTALHSRRLRLFFVLSVLIHLVAVAALVLSPGLRGYILGRGDQPVGAVEASASDLAKAIDTLTGIARKRLLAACAELDGIQARLDAVQAAALDRLRTVDAERLAQAQEKGGRPYTSVCDAQPEPFPPVDPPGTTSAAEAPDLLTLHARLVRREERCGRLFERWHAAALASHPEEPIPLSAGLKNVRMKLTPRRTPDAAALDAAAITSATDGKLAAYRAALNDLYLESLDMVATAQRWLDQIEKREAQTQSLFGQQTKYIPPPDPYFGHFLDPKLLKKVSLERMINPAASLGAALGRDSEVTRPSDWMSIDRWYTVGPFTHPGSSRRLEDLERRFPPEVAVDLDAVYEGKDGRQLTWKYRHTGPDFLEGGIRVEPYVVDNGSFAIWYFYAEVRCDEAKQVLASFASDDYGVCWLNGRRVFQSPPTNQPWVPYTRLGFRVLDLVKGTNKFLFKLENGLGATGFSVILMTHEDREIISLFQQTQGAR